MKLIDKKFKRKIELILFFLTVVTNSCNSQFSKKDIVMINVGPYDKGRIAKLISYVNELNPKVISLDIAFLEYKGDDVDKGLYKALLKVKRLVLPSEIVSEGNDFYGNEMISVYLTCAGEFSVPNSETGFVSALATADRTNIPKQFIVWQKGNSSEDVYHHFSVVTAMSFDSLKTSNFIQSHERLVDIDYKEGRQFTVFSYSDVLKGRLVKKDVEGKIIMMGFLGPGNTDRFYTSNGSEMYGLEYLANIVAQILE